MADIQESGDEHVRGSVIAPVTLLEYGDYQCPYCRGAHEIVLQLLDHFGQELRYVFRNFPLVELHPYAEIAAEAAESAGDLGNFWGMHDTLFVHQDDLRPESLLRYAQSLGLDAGEMVEDLREHRFLPRIQSDYDQGIMMGVEGTPTFYINGQYYNGDLTAEGLIEAVENALAEEEGDLSKEA